MATRWSHFFSWDDQISWVWRQQAVRDVGFLPEGEIHSRSEGSSPYALGHDPARYPLETILETAELASGLKPEATETLRTRLTHPDSAVRYWASLGILMRSEAGFRACRADVEKALTDVSPYVRANAAEMLGRYGSAEDLKKALALLTDLGSMTRHGPYVSLWALNSLSALGDKAAGVQEALRALPRKAPKANIRAAEYPARVLDQLLGIEEGQGD